MQREAGAQLQLGQPALALRRKRLQRGCRVVSKRRSGLAEKPALQGTACKDLCVAVVQHVAGCHTCGLAEAAVTCSERHGPERPTAAVVRILFHHKRRKHRPLVCRRLTLAWQAFERRQCSLHNSLSALRLASFAVRHVTCVCV